MAKIKNKMTVPVVGENEEQLEFSHAVGENLNWYKLFGKHLSQTL